MANPVGQSSHANTHQQDMGFEKEENAQANALGIQFLGNNFEELHTARRRNLKKRKKQDPRFVVTDVQGK